MTAFMQRMNGLDGIAALKAFGKETRLRILRLVFKEQFCKV